MKRFEPDIDGIKEILLSQETHEKRNGAVWSARLSLKERFFLACHEAGETPLHDNADDIERLATQRMEEKGKGLHGVPGFRSDIRMVVAHQELWGINDKEKLVAKMHEVLKGVRKDTTYYERKDLERYGLFDERE